MRQSVNECTNHSDNLNSGRGRDNGRGSRLQEQRCSRSARFLDTEPSASAQRFFSYCASLGICEITIFGVQITGVFVCNETCVLKHVAFRISPLSRLSHEIFGFRTHSPSVNIVVFPDVTALALSFPGTASAQTNWHATGMCKRLVDSEGRASGGRVSCQNSMHRFRDNHLDY
jgi:hypothetical protein